jgi:Tol biopolymer transport system component
MQLRLACAGLLLAAAICALVVDGSAAAQASQSWRVAELRLVSGSTVDTGMRVVSVSRSGTRRVVASSKGWTAVSPDGRYRAWYAHGNGQTRVLVAPISGGTPRIVAATACASPLHACATASALAWSRTNRLAFMSYGDRELGDSRAVLVVTRSDGTVLRRYTYPGTDAAGRSLFYGRPLWSPDGQSFVFDRSVFDGATDVLLADTKTWAVRRVFRAVHHKDPPFAAWSPDSRSLAIVTQGWDRVRDPAYALVRVATGRVAVRKAHCETGPACPTGAGVVWSPDGGQIAYATSTGIARARTDLSAATYVLETSTPPNLQGWTRDGLIGIDSSGDRLGDGSGWTAVAINPVTGSTTRTIYASPPGWQPAEVAATG